VQCSHAWFQSIFPVPGWLDYDPTNTSVPVDQTYHAGCGGVIMPNCNTLKGIAFGGGQHTLVGVVDVLRAGIMRLKVQGFKVKGSGWLF